MTPGNKLQLHRQRLWFLLSLWRVWPARLRRLQDWGSFHYTNTCLQNSSRKIATFFFFILTFYLTFSVAAQWNDLECISIMIKLHFSTAQFKCRAGEVLSSKLVEKGTLYTLQPERQAGTLTNHDCINWKSCAPNIFTVWQKFPNVMAQRDEV